MRPVYRGGQPPTRRHERSEEVGGKRTASVTTSVPRLDYARLQEIGRTPLERAGEKPTHAPVFTCTLSSTILFTVDSWLL